MSDHNSSTLTGRLTSDPELRHTPSGKAVCNFRLASSRTYSDANGKKGENTTFIDITAWNRLAEIVHEHCHQGDRILVTGRLEMETWDDKKTGQSRSKHKIYAAEVTFISRRREEGEQSQDATRSKTTAAGGPAHDRDEPDMPEGDDIPF